MLRSELFSAAAALSLLLPMSSGQPQPLRREADGWVRTYVGTMPRALKLHINGHGPVTVEGGASQELTYTVKLNVPARNAAEAARLLARLPVQVTSAGDWVVLTTPGGRVISTVTVQAPRLTALEVSTTEGAVEARGIEGSVQVDSAAGELSADRIKGQCSLVTGGGAVKVGTVEGPLQCRTGAGPITVKSARGETLLVTQGGDISATQVGGALNAQTAGGGEIVVEKANGVVTAHNMAGPVQVGAAAGVHCESGTGGIRLSNIAGGMHVSTSMGSIFANLFGSKLADSSLATGSGDITVLIPAGVRLTIKAENDRADSMRRIVSDFPGIPVRIRGNHLVAEGPLNGGGPLLQISGTGGTIYLKRQ